MSSHPSLYVIEHPLLTDQLARLRDQHTPRTLFQQLLHRATLLLSCAVTKSFPTQPVTIQTPLGDCATTQLKDHAPVIVPILRSGLGMLPALQTLLPTARVGFVGIQRDEQTHQPQLYYAKLPTATQDCPVLICDPMLATGGTMAYTIQILKEAAFTQIRVMTLLCAPEGIANVHQQHPQTPIYTACVDPHLTKDAFIYPGLGDAGDRLFGTQD